MATTAAAHAMSRLELSPSHQILTGKCRVRVGVGRVQSCWLREMRRACEAGIRLSGNAVSSPEAPFGMQLSRGLPQGESGTRGFSQQQLIPRSLLRSAAHLLEDCGLSDFSAWHEGCVCYMAISGMNGAGQSGP